MRIQIYYSKFKMECNIILFAVLYASLNVLFNQPLLTYATSHLEISSFNGIMTLVGLSILQFMTVFLFLMGVALFKNLIKPVCIILLITNSIAYYFISSYHVVLDVTMMSNLYNSNFSEVKELYNYKVILYIFIYGIIPSIFLNKVKINNLTILKRSLAVALSVVFTVIFTFISSQTWLWFDRNFKVIGGLSMPMSYIVNSMRYFNANYFSSQKESKLPNPTFFKKNKTIVVVVIGESARAQNFSLYGYHRKTNPHLEKDNVTAMVNTTSCATYTTASLKCILSHIGSNQSWLSLYEPLPTYLQRNNINVIWRSNNTGEPRMKVGLYQKAEDIRSDCKGDRCKYLIYDDALTYRLKDLIKNNLNNNTLIFLHQTGSHGPLYTKKYPPQFNLFKPSCNSVELQKCSHQELVNAYDNTIVYTDHILHRVIKTLKSFKDSSSVMIYISDHGESLGESGFYLHGAPSAIAPKEQRKVPFIIWRSDLFKKEHKLNNTNFTKQAHHSHDDIFHSVMGAFNMGSIFYEKKHDVFNY